MHARFALHSMELVFYIISISYFSSIASPADVSSASVVIASSAALASFSNAFFTLYIFMALIHSIIP